MRQLATLLLLSLVLLTPQEGVAQAPPKETVKEAERGGGIRLTDEARLHPFVQTALAYDNNPNLLPTNTVGDALFIIEGGGEIYVPSDVLEMRARLALNYNYYLGLGNADTDGDGVDDVATDGLSAAKGGAELQLLGNKKRRLRWGLALRSNRVDDPTPLIVGSRTGRLYSTLNLLLEWRPGGQAMGFKIQPNGSYDAYDGLNAEEAAKGATYDPTAANSTRYGLRADYDWRIFPRTQLVLNNSWMVSRSQDTTSNPLNSEIGFMGQITPQISAIVAGGYALSGLVDSLNLGGDGQAAADTSTFIGQFEVRYDEKRSTTTRVGFRRALLPAAYHGTMQNNQFYFRYYSRFGRGLRALFNAQYDLRIFGALTGDKLQTLINVGGDDRIDHQVSVNGSLLYQPKRNWLAGVSVRPDYVATNSSFNKGTPEEPEYAAESGYLRLMLMFMFEAKL
ncbi:MAG: hypothetical protein VX405_06525 [Myxococcota bacterium]|nr:hypothetical protein [Myxococcota bacterium]